MVMFQDIEIKINVIGTYTTNGVMGCTCDRASNIGFSKSLVVSSLFETNFADIYADVTM
jgi:hypothetical protein